MPDKSKASGATVQLLTPALSDGTARYVVIISHIDPAIVRDRDSAEKLINELRFVMGLAENLAERRKASEESDYEQ